MKLLSQTKNMIGMTIKDHRRSENKMEIINQQNDFLNDQQETGNEYM